MRVFERESQDFFQFQLEGNDEIYQIPLPASMKNKQIVAFQNAGDDYMKQVEWLRLFIGDVVDDLTLSETSDILKAWVNASKDSGASVGESSALSD